jgi:glucosylceramidase
VLDTVGKGIDKRDWKQNALITIDTGAKKFNLTPAYYVFRHLSQFVEPGAVRVGTQGGDALAFKNPDGSIVTVMYNSGGSPAATTLAVAGKSLQFSIPAHGWATVNWQKQ